MEDDEKTRDQLIEELRRLRREEEISRTLIRYASDAVFQIDSSMTILSFNDAFLEHFGFPGEEEARGCSASVLYPSKESFSSFFDKFNRSVAAGGTFRAQWGLTRQDGTVFPAELRIFGMNTPGAGSLNGPSRYSVLVRDLTAEKEQERQNALTAMHDQLTGLPNRVLLNDRIYRAILQGEKGRRPFAVISIRLERLKAVNEMFGYTAGDDLLREAAVRLKAAVQRSSTVARMAGSEFVLLLPEVGSRDGAVMLAGTVLASFEQPFLLDDREVRATLRIGITLYPEDGGTGGNLLRRANLAMHSAPENAVKCYSSTLEGQHPPVLTAD